MISKETYRKALKERAPKLYAQMEKVGDLEKHVRDAVTQANDSVNERVTETFLSRKGNRLGPIEQAALMNAIKAELQEIELAQMLEFPPDETSPPSPGATTHSPAPTT